MSLQVVPAKGGKWAVRKTGAKRAIKRFEDKGDAVSMAIKIRQRTGYPIYIFRKDGTIEEKV